MNSSVMLSGVPHPKVLDALGKLSKKIDLSRGEMRSLMKKIMTGDLSVAQVAAIIIALRVKGETVEEIVGAVEIMRIVIPHRQEPEKKAHTAQKKVPRQKKSQKIEKKCKNQI